MAFWNRKQVEAPVAKEVEAPVAIERAAKLEVPKKVKRNYDALLTSLIPHWNSATFDNPDAVASSSFENLVVRARSLERNNAIVSRYFNVLSSIVVGDDGFRLSSNVNTDQGTPDDLARQRIELAWKDFMLGPVTPEGLTFLELTNLVLRSVARDGEAFIYLDPTKPLITMIDPLRVPVQLNRTDVVNGVNLNPDSTVSGYWIGPDSYQQPSFYSAESIIHLYRCDRPGQRRGISWLANVMVSLELLYRYQKAELGASQLGARLRGFFTKPAEVDPISPVDEAIDPIKMSNDNLEFFELPEGLEYQQVNTSHPNSSFDAFTNAIKRDIASGLNFSYDLLMSDQSALNFSSGKLGRTIDLAYVKTLQQFLVRNFANKVFYWWIEQAIASGVVNLPIAKLERFKNHKFTPRAFSTVLRPLEEANATEKELQLGLTSLSRVLRERGSSIEAVIAERMKDKDMLLKAGLMPSVERENNDSNS